MLDYPLRIISNRISSRYQLMWLIIIIFIYLLKNGIVIYLVYLSFHSIQRLAPQFYFPLLSNMSTTYAFYLRLNGFFLFKINT